jgi:hypothetical protein
MLLNFCKQIGTKLKQKKYIRGQSLKANFRGLKIKINIFRWIKTIFNPNVDILKLPMNF